MASALVRHRLTFRVALRIYHNLSRNGGNRVTERRRSALSEIQELWKHGGAEFTYSHFCDTADERTGQII
jgi:hypothetical protein